MSTSAVARDTGYYGFVMAQGERLPALVPEELEDDELVTQRVARGLDAPPEYNQPKYPEEFPAVSVIRGALTPEEALRRVRKGMSTATRDDGVRRATVGTLRDAGFILTHTPTNRNPDHVSVTYPGDWERDVALLFKTCFATTEWHGGEEQG